MDVMPSGILNNFSQPIISAYNVNCFSDSHIVIVSFCFTSFLVNLGCLLETRICHFLVKQLYYLWKLHIRSKIKAVMSLEIRKPGLDCCILMLYFSVAIIILLNRA